MMKLEPHCNVSANCNDGEEPVKSGFASLRRQVVVEHFGGPDPDFQADAPAQAFYPSDPEYIGWVYFDRARVPADEVDSIMKQYAAKYPAHTLHPRAIDVADFRLQRFVTSVRAEKTFYQRRYVSTLEDRQLPAGNPPDTAFAKAHKEVVHEQAFFMGKMLEQIVGNRPEPVVQASSQRQIEFPDAPRHRLAPLTGHDATLSREEIGAAWETWKAEFDEQDDEPDWKPFLTKKTAPPFFALVESNGLLLGRKRVSADDIIHMAYSGTPDSFGRGGRLLLNSDRWANCTNRTAERRLAQELLPKGTANIFHSFHWPSLRSEPEVTPEMIVAWQSQVLASLRKITWRIAADEGPTAINNELYADRYAPTLRNESPRTPAGTRRLAWLEPAASKIDAWLANDVARYVESLEQDRRAAGPGNAYLDLSHRDLLIGAMHGMNYDLRDPQTPSLDIYDMAYWLGNLRRRGKATIDCWFSDSLLNHVDLDPLQPLIFSMLSEQAWEVLLEAALELLEPMPNGGIDTTRTIDVTYTWSHPDRPWSAVYDGATVAIEGPMLFFPVSESAFWREKAEFIRENGGFVAPAK